MATRAHAARTVVIYTAFRLCVRAYVFACTKRARTLAISQNQRAFLRAIRLADARWPMCMRPSCHHHPDKHARIWFSYETYSGVYVYSTPVHRLWRDVRFHTPSCRYIHCNILAATRTVARDGHSLLAARIARTRCRCTTTALLCAHSHTNGTCGGGCSARRARAHTQTLKSTHTQVRPGHSARLADCWMRAYAERTRARLHRKR